jgi:hypothetical protein
MSIQLPKKLKNFNLFVDGIGFAGRAEEASLQTLTVKSEDHTAGLDTPFPVDTGMDVPSLSFDLAEPAGDVVKHFAKVEEIGITLIGTCNDDESTASEPVTITARGVIGSMDLGSWSAGNKVSPKFTMKLTYVKVQALNGGTFELDIKNNKRMVNGTDMVEVIRGKIKI